MSFGFPLFEHQLLHFLILLDCVQARFKHKKRSHPFIVGLFPLCLLLTHPLGLAPMHPAPILRLAGTHAAVLVRVVQLVQHDVIPAQGRIEPLVLLVPLALDVLLRLVDCEQELVTPGTEELGTHCPAHFVLAVVVFFFFLRVFFLPFFLSLFVSLAWPCGFVF